MTSRVVPGWGLSVLSVHSVCSRELGALPLLPGHPAPALWLLALGGPPRPSAFLAPVQMTLSRPQMEFSVTAWPLRSCGNVPGSPPSWVGCGGSLRPCSRHAFPMTPLPSPSRVFSGCLLPGFQDGRVALSTLPLELQSCNCIPGGKWKQLF